MLPLNRNPKVICDNCVPKLQSLILFVTRRDVQLEHCILPSVPISPQKPEKSWNILLLKTTAPQNPLILSNVNIVIKSFRDFTLYVNIKTSNMLFLSRQQLLMRTVSSTNFMRQILKKSCAHVNNFLIDTELEHARQKVFNCATENLIAKTVDKKLDHFFNNLKCAAKVNLALGFSLRRWKVQIFLLTRKQYPAGLIQTSVQHGRLGKTKRFSQHNWCHRFS